jgi:hypothetical protein
VAELIPPPPPPPCLPTAVPAIPIYNATQWDPIGYLGDRLVESAATARALELRLEELRAPDRSRVPTAYRLDEMSNIAPHFTEYSWAYHIHQGVRAAAILMLAEALLFSFALEIYLHWLR